MIVLKSKIRKRIKELEEDLNTWYSITQDAFEPPKIIVKLEAEIKGLKKLL